MDTAQMNAAIERLQARRGELLRGWGPERLEPLLVERFGEAVGAPDGKVVPPTILIHLGIGRVDVHEDVRPQEVIDNALANPVNGGTAYQWSRPLEIGDEISGQVILKDAYLRESRSGPLAMVVVQTRFTDRHGKDVGTADKTMIYRGVKA